jgi:hypothetical protein
MIRTVVSLFLLASAVSTNGLAQKIEKIPAPTPAAPARTASGLPPEVAEPLADAARLPEPARTLTELAALEALMPMHGGDETQALERVGNALALRMAEAYARSGKDPQLTTAVAGSILRTYAVRRSKASSAPQASQAADEAGVRLLTIQVGQNQAIISLLEQIARKR